MKAKTAKALEDTQLSHLCVPTSEGEARTLIGYEKSSAQLNHGIRVLLGEYFYEVSQQFKNGENTEYNSFNEWVAHHKQVSGFPSRSTVFDYIKRYKKEHQLDEESGKSEQRPVTVQVKGLSKESIEYLESYSTASNPQKRRDALQKLLDFLEDDGEIQERFQSYMRETNPEPNHVEPAELEAKIKLHTEYQDEEAKIIAREMANAITHCSPDTENAKKLRELHHQLNRKQWQYWTS